MPRAVYSRLLLLTLLITSAACAPRPQSRLREAQVGEPRDVLGDAEISRSNTRTAHEAIQRLRPEYLSIASLRGSADGRLVYVDGIRFGGLEALHAISSTTVREIRRLHAREATIRLGAGHSAGAILIVTKTGR